MEDAEAQLAECEQEHCIKVLWVVKVQCAPTWTCPTAQTSALAAYQTHEQLNANATARMPKFRQPTVRVPIYEAVNSQCVFTSRKLTSVVHDPKDSGTSYRISWDSA